MKSLMHADFANPRAQSCWLSTTFQALWHSRRFRKAYQELVEPLREYPPNTVTGAFQRTWRSYTERKVIDEKKNRRASRVGISPVHLTEVWGNQYGTFHMKSHMKISHSFEQIQTIKQEIPVMSSRNFKMLEKMKPRNSVHSET